MRVVSPSRLIWTVVAVAAALSATSICYGVTTVNRLIPDGPSDIATGWPDPAAPHWSRLDEFDGNGSIDAISTGSTTTVTDKYHSKLSGPTEISTASKHSLVLTRRYKEPFGAPAAWFQLQVMDSSGNQMDAGSLTVPSGSGDAFTVTEWNSQTNSWNSAQVANWRLWVRGQSGRTAVSAQVDEAYVKFYNP